ncbi:uncharacterized protein LOC102680836 [Apis dorsata]|uniref:uncharacterized protein LOC102680836 n=1 Tax=Apis dorsata TaxID=7462 RepID=UPI00129305BD|nr:uncharacterized protein LOC102680836 [Apis dorsata]
MKGVAVKRNHQQALLAAVLLPVLLLGSAVGEIERRTSKQMVEESAESLASGLSKDCGKSYSATCLKLDVVSFLDRLSGTLGAIGFGALALLAGKALMTGLMALMLSAIVGLKSLASGGEKKTTYEIVSKPVYSSSHTHSSEEHHGHGYGHSGYGRSLDAIHEDVEQAVLKYGNVRDRRSLLRQN